jgi:hypothetical protein
MPRLPLAQCCPYFGHKDPFVKEREAAMRFKRRGRAELARSGVPARVVGAPFEGDIGDRLIVKGRAWEAQRATKAAGGRGPRNGGRADPAFKLQNPECKTSFDASTKVTTIDASASINCPVEKLAPIVDPRAWGLGEGIIDIAFPVSRKDHDYLAVTSDVDDELGKEWKRPGLLFEYARSEIASFENILRIKRFEWERDSLVVEYELYDCLKTIIGYMALDGGMQLNDGSVTVSPDGDGGAFIEVVKNIRIRDFTPNDAGSRYDFGESINSTIGAALSVWVDDTSMMSPVF